MLDRTNQLGNFDRTFPADASSCPTRQGLALVPDFVRQSVPNTPFITAAEAGLAETAALYRHEQREPATWRRVAAFRRFAHRHSRRRRRLYGAAPRIGQLLDGRHGDRGGPCVSRTPPTTPFVFPQHLVGGHGTGFAASWNPGFPPRQSDRHEGSTTVQWNADLRARPRLEYRSARQLRRVDHERPHVESGPESSAVEHSRICGRQRAVRSPTGTSSRRATTHPVALPCPGNREPNKRFSNSVALNASYTIARAPVGRRAAQCRRRSPPRTERRRSISFRGDADFGNVAFTRRHRFVGTFLYELPVGGASAA